MDWKCGGRYWNTKLANVLFAYELQVGSTDQMTCKSWLIGVYSSRMRSGSSLAVLTECAALLFSNTFLRTLHVQLLNADFLLHFQREPL
eukprot:1159229-Pelagomonas_calceolata.AAC.3